MILFFICFADLIMLYLVIMFTEPFLPLFVCLLYAVQVQVLEEGEGEGERAGVGESI
jgi:hypothetical protein